MLKSKQQGIADTPKKEFPLFSIVVLNWNGLEDTKICLEHVWKLDYPNFEVIVVDNGSRSDSKDYLSKLENIIYIDNPVNRGFTGGHIDGLAHCSGEYIVLLNNDAVMKKDYLTKALEHFSDPKVAVVGGRSYWWNEDNQILDEANQFYSYQQIDPWTGEARMLDYDYGQPQEVNNVSGSCVVVRKSIIDQLGYLYDRFFAYFEETDLFARVKRAGYTVLYDPRLQIWHKNGASSGASGGSYFFYYHIFRNRFIFATRNFETKFLLKFWIIYYGIALKSLLKFLLRRGDDKMNKAYAAAAWYNIITLFRNLRSRHSLTSTLGKSAYNHQIWIEQTGVSFVIDATRLKQADFDSLVNTLMQDKNVQHEYVLVISESTRPNRTQFNLRCITDRGYFDTNPLNLGVIAARHPWITITSAEEKLDYALAQVTLNSVMGSKKQLFAYKNASEQMSNFLLLSKDLFQKMGGFGNKKSASDIRNWLVLYAGRTKSINWIFDSSLNLSWSEMPIASSDRTVQLKSAIRFDKQLQSAHEIHWFHSLQLKYYRFYQVTTFVKWIFTLKVPFRLKAARMKNLIVFTLTLNKQALATEFKHIRNEVVLNDSHHINTKEQHSIIRKRLEDYSKDVTAIPVFIICRDRVDALSQLVTWLEAHGQTKIIFIDNDSSYRPLLEYFDKTSYQVLQLNRNVGHTSPWSLEIVRALVPDDFYIVTDPDVIPVDDCPDDVINYFVSVHKQFFAYEKVGFGLKIDDLPDYFPLKNHVIEWESQFWKTTIGDNLYEAGIDTTFALYKPFTYIYTLHPSIRTGGNYVARHMPWYHDPKKDTDEDIYYRFRANRNVNSWNAGELPERYAKEMKPNT